MPCRRMLRELGVETFCPEEDEPAAMEKLMWILSGEKWSRS